ncbi:MAG: helicase-associated domain-containing protein [Firmicutes bacterium]|nr:helicase-associated domain-containing protein [Bacillota bacterium]
MNQQFQSLGNILAQLSDDDRATLAQTLNEPEVSDEVLARRLLDPARVEEMVQHRSPELTAALTHWVANRGVWADYRRYPAVTKGIRELAEWGYCFEVRYGPYGAVPVTPWELMPRLLPLLWDIPWKRLTVPSAPRSLSLAPVWTPLTHDLFQVLSFARREPLLLTTQGEIYQRLRNKLEKMMWPRPEINPAATLQHIIMMLQRVDFLWVRDDPYSLEVSTMVDPVFEAGPQRLFQRLSSHWFDPSHVAWPQFIWVSLLSLIPPDQALKLPETVKWLQHLGFSGVAQDPLIYYALDELAAYDLLDPKSTVGAMRLSDWAYAAMNGHFEVPESHQVIVQPNGEILVPPSVPMGERWTIDRLATRLKSERVMTYRLDAAAVKRGVEQGLTAQQHLAALDALAAHPLPDNVRINVEDWYRQFGWHRIMEVTIIHSQSPEDSLNIERVLGKEVRGRLSPTDIIIGQDRVKDVLKRLEKAGHPLLPNILRPSQEEMHRSGVYASLRRVEDWSIGLWHPPTTPPPIDAMRKQFREAIRQGRAIELTYHANSHGGIQTDTVLPIMVDGEWVQVFVMNQGRYVTVPWRQILSFE